jgi:two-component system cell cycle sensor histidine kinase/response regulator CckA
MTNSGSPMGKAVWVLAVVTIAIGLAVILGWVFDLDVLKSIVPGMVSMNPLTAITFILAGTSLALSLESSSAKSPRASSLLFIARTCAILVFIVGLIKLTGYLCGLDLGIDRYLFSQKLLIGVQAHPNRLAPNTALSFLLLGIALAFAGTRSERGRFWLQLFMAVLSFNSFLAILGYAYDVQSLYDFRGFSPMALITAITFLILCTGFFMSQTDKGFFAILISESVAGSLLRRLLPAAVLIPTGLGWIILQGEKAGLYETGEAIFAISNIAVFVAVIFWTALVLYRTETLGSEATDALRLVNLAVLQSKESVLITTANLNLPGPEIIFTNPAFTEMTGYSAKEVLGKTPRILQGPLTDKKVLHELRRNLEAGDVFEGETVNYRKDGTPFDLEWQIAPLKNDNGELTHFVAIQRDVTERHQAQKDILFSEKRFRSLVEATTAIVWDTPPSGEFEIEQPAWTAFTGQRFDQLRGWGWLDAVHPDDRAETTRLWSDAVATASVYICEHRLRAADGTYHDMMVRAVPILNPSGEIVQFVGIHTDITEQKRMESRYRRLVDSNAQGVIFWNRSGKITGANDAFLNLVGYTRKDLEAGLIDWIKLTPPEHAAIDQRALEEIATRGFSSLCEKEYIRKDGSRVPVLYGAAAFEDSPDEGVCFFLDLTDRKRLEHQLFQSQKMETVGKLAGSIAHEFNSILTAIIGQSELIQNDLESGNPLIKNATEIHKAALRAAGLTRQILAYGRKQILTPESLDLNFVLDGMTSTLKHLMGLETDVRVVPGSALKMVKADAGQIEQVIVNIALNARDAMPRGGKLTLETRNVSFTAESVGGYPELKAGDYVMLAITDTGTGMSPKVLSRIFDPFYTTKDVGQGTGLGLSSCYGIIKQSGGHISAYSEPARGTVLKIYLPQFASPAVDSPKRLDSPGLPRGTETILLAEDDPSLLEMSAGLLRRLGYTVLTAENGLQALGLGQQRNTGHIDLLLTDVVMPHMTGTELSDRIKSIYPHTKIIFTSAYTENAIFHQGILNEGVTLLQKPFTPSTLAQKVRAVLDQGSPLPL